MKTAVARIGLTALIAVIGLVTWGSHSPSLALTVTAGYDLFQTVPGVPPFPSTAGTWFDVPPPGLPPGFFGSKSGTPSDPVPPGRLYMAGLPTGPLGNPPSPFTPDPFPENDPIVAAQHFVRPPLNPANTDTIVRRLSDAILPFDGATDTVPIEIISLSLTSVAPIQVTYGAEPPSFFDVFVDLSPFPVPPFQGTMTLTRTHPNGGTFDSFLPVTARVRFNGTQPTDPTASEITQFPKQFFSEDVPFSFISPIPEPGTLVLALVGLVSMALFGRRRRSE